MKKILAIFTMVLMTMGLVACDKNEAPKISGAQNITYTIGEELPNYLNNLEAEDKEDGNLTQNIIVNQTNIDLNTPGEYELTYFVFDSKGLKAEEKITVKVIKKEATSVTEYITNTDYKTLITKPVSLELALNLPKLTLKQETGLSLALHEIDVKISLDYDLSTYHDLNIEALLNVEIKEVDIVANDEIVPWFALKGETKISIKNQMLTMISNYPIYDLDGEVIGNLSEILGFAKMMGLPEEILPIIDSIISIVENKTTTQEVNYNETHQALLQLLGPSILNMLTERIVNEQMIENSDFKITLGNTLKIEKEGNLIEPSILEALGILPDALVGILSSVKNIVIELDNQNQVFQSLNIKTDITLDETTNGHLSLNLNIGK